MVVPTISPPQQRQHPELYCSQWLCPNSGDASFEGCIRRMRRRRLRHSDAPSAVPIPRVLQMRPTNAAFFSRILRMHRLYPSRPNVSQDPSRPNVSLPRFIAHSIQKIKQQWRRMWIWLFHLNVSIWFPVTRLFYDTNVKILICIVKNTNKLSLKLISLK